MKLEVKLILSIFIIGILILFLGTSNFYLQAQQTTQKATHSTKTSSVTTTAPEKQKNGLVEYWVNDFETCEDWRAISTSPLGDVKIMKIPGKPRPFDDQGNAVEYPNEITDDNGITHKCEYVLGVKSYVMDRGYDRVEVLPPNEEIIPGKAKEIKVWVLGRKLRHTLYIKLKDYRGILHKIKLGRLDFWGWREMDVMVPGWIPQSATYAMLDKNLYFVSFFVESDPFESAGTYYFYLDNFRIITDMSEFTGDTYIKDNW
jgi:hypothetical protein